MIASVTEVFRDGAQLAPRAEQVNLDLAGDGAGQSLMADFEVRAQLRQQHPQDEGGHHRQRHHSRQRDSRRQPQTEEGERMDMVLLDHHELAIAHDRDDAIPPCLAEIIEDDRMLEAIEAAQGQYGFLEASLH